MLLFSEEYLVHYGVKGMKWRKKKNEEYSVRDYYTEAERTVLSGYRNNRKTNPNSLSDAKRINESVKSQYGSDGYLSSARLNNFARSRNKDNKLSPQRQKIQSLADSNRRADIKAAREAAYKKNQKRVKRQQRKAKVKNTINRLIKKDN